MQKNIYFYTLFLCLLSHTLFGQVNYSKENGSLGVSSSSVVLPNATITPDTIFTDNAGNNLASAALYNRLNYIFAPLDKSQVPTGFLSEYGLGLVPPEVYNGVISSENQVNIAEWRLLYGSLLTARIYGSNPLPELSAVNSSIAAYGSGSNPVPIPVLHLNYAGLKPDALTRNLLSTQNDQLFDVAGRTESPYAVKSAFAACPSRGYAGSGNVSFILRPELFYTNTGKTVSSTKIDFGDGRGLLTVSWNTPVSASYTSTGTKHITVRFTYTDGSIVESRSEFKITRLSGATARYGAGLIVGQPFAPAPGVHSGGTAFIDLSVNNGTGRIRRPLIFVEGYDMSSIAPDLQTNYDFDNFIGNLQGPVPDYDLSAQLDDVDSYDLIFLDYTNGTDDIRRNAALLQEVIAWVNEQKRLSGVTVPNVIMGWSMGGLVGRYALANMEKQRRTSSTAQNDHQTRLLITIDSPHRGANIPLGVQFLALDAGDIRLGGGIPGIFSHSMPIRDFFPALEQVTKALFAPATQQLLIHRALPWPAYGIANNTFLDGDYRTMITFPATSPAPYRVIATSGGSECGTKVLEPHTELARATGNFFHLCLS